MKMRADVVTKDVGRAEVGELKHFCDRERSS